jgi:outer membrane receptor protein involved in Fe transport
LEEDFDFAGLGSAVQLLSWPDFLLGLDALHNASRDVFGLLNRELTGWESALFVQHTYRIRPSLTLNLGLRYERLGQFGDEPDRNSSFDVSKAIAHSPPSGSLDGYIAASNFPGDLPPGVLRAKNTFGTYGEGQDTFLVSYARCSNKIALFWKLRNDSSRTAPVGARGACSI